MITGRAEVLKAAAMNKIGLIDRLTHHRRNSSEGMYS